MSATSKRIVLAEGQEISYVLERKQVKNLNLRIRKDGNVFVSANDAVPFDEVDELVCYLADEVHEEITDEMIEANNIDNIDREETNEDSSSQTDNEVAE